MTSPYILTLLDRKLILQEPEIGKEHEIVFIPQKAADRLWGYTLWSVRALKIGFSQFPNIKEQRNLFYPNEGKGKG